MFRMILILLFTFIMISSINAQPYVVIDTMNGSYICGELSGYGDYNLQIGIANPDSIQMTAVMTLKIYTESGTILPYPEFTFMNDFDVQIGYEDNYFQNEIFNFTTIGDTIIVLFGGVNGLMGLPQYDDTISFFNLRFENLRDYLNENDILYIDSAEIEGTPLFDAWDFSSPTNVTWSGLKSFAMAEFPPHCHNFEIYNNYDEDTIITDICNPVSIYIGAYYWEYCSHPVVFDLLQGPGDYIHLNTWNIVYNYIPEIGDENNLYEVEVMAGLDFCGDSTYLYDGRETNFYLDVVHNSPPSFVYGQNRKFVKQPGEELFISLVVEDDGPLINHNYWYYIDTVQDTDPPGILDENTGVFQYTGTEADTNTYYVYLVVQEGNCSDTMGFYIYHYESYLCGDMDHTGILNIADLVWAVNYIFKGGPPPVTEEAGNVDCEPGIFVSDLSYMVNYIFKSGAAPCEGCP